MSAVSTTVADLGDLVQLGIERSLKIMIKEKLLASVDQILEDMAVEIAENIVVRAESMRVPHGQTFGPETRVVLQFNLKDPPMVYDTETKTMQKRDVVKR